MNSGEKGKDGSWYPGKYLVKAANYASGSPSSSSNNDPAIGTLEPQTEMDDLYPEPYIPHPEEDVANIIKATSKATISPSVLGPSSAHSLTGSSSGRRSSWLGSFSGDSTTGPIEDPKLNEKIETVICRLVNNVRTKCQMRKLGIHLFDSNVVCCVHLISFLLCSVSLVGSFTITRDAGDKKAITAVTCSLNGEGGPIDGEGAVVCGDNADAMVLTTNILDSLEQRSETWQSIDFKDDIKLTGNLIHPITIFIVRFTNLMLFNIHEYT